RPEPPARSDASRPVRIARVRRHECMRPRDARSSTTRAARRDRRSCADGTHHPCRHRRARKLGVREAPSFATVRCQSFRDGLSTKGMQMNRRVAHLFARWRTGLSRSVLILQAGNALNYFGYGLVLPFEIIYLHHVRGFSTSTAGLVLAATMATSAIATPPTGALADRYSAKALVVVGSLASALGYTGFAFVVRPWQGFACSIVSGVGLGAAGTANGTLVVRLIRPEQRAAAFALNRVAGNFGIGSGATVAGF